jgi:hypothetical protein
MTSAQGCSPTSRARPVAGAERQVAPGGARVRSGSGSGAGLRTGSVMLAGMGDKRLHFVSGSSCAAA